MPPCPVAWPPYKAIASPHLVSGKQEPGIALVVGENPRARLVVILVVIIAQRSQINIGGGETVASLDFLFNVVIFVKIMKLWA